MVTSSLEFPAEELLPKLTAIGPFFLSHENGDEDDDEDEDEDEDDDDDDEDEEEEEEELEV